MKESNTYKHYLRDLFYLLKERHEEHLNNKINNEFEEGIEFAYNSIIELIKSQADAFQMNLDDIGFNNFEKSNEKK